MAEKIESEENSPGAMKFFYSQPTRAFETYKNLSESVAQHGALKRATVCGFGLIALAIFFAFCATVIPKFDFPVQMSMAILIVGGALLAIGILGETWMKVTALSADSGLPADTVAVNKSVINELLARASVSEPDFPKLK